MKFAKEEKEHMEISKKYDTGKDRSHRFLKDGIKRISKLAIKLSERV